MANTALAALCMFAGWMHLLRRFYNRDKLKIAPFETTVYLVSCDYLL